MSVIFTLVNIYLLTILFRAVYPLCTGFFYRNKGHLVHEDNKDYHPLVSVIIPAWNEEKGIEKTILSVLNNSYDNFEIVCVNDGSKDNTLSIMNKLKDANPDKIVVVDQVNKGKAEALNVGIATAKGEVVVTIDADSYIDKDAVKYLVNGLSNPKYAAAVGSIKVGNKKNLVGIIQYLEYNFGYQTKRSQSIFNSIFIIPGALCAIRKDVVNEVGGYESYCRTEDFDISLKIREKGHNIIHVDEALCITEGAPTFSFLLKQRFRWRHGGILCYLRHRKLFFSLKQHKYLSFFELPLAALSLFDLLMYPLIFAFIIFSVFITQDIFTAIMFYLIMPIGLICIMDKDIEKDPKLIFYILISPFLFNALSFIEFIALIKSLYRIIFVRTDIGWTNWVRKGI